MCFPRFINPIIDTSSACRPAHGEGDHEKSGIKRNNFEYLPSEHCIRKPLVVFMGGAADPIIRILFRVAKNYQELHQAYQDVYYRPHNAGAHVVKLVEAYHAAGRKVAVIGHSWGGSSAVHDVAMKTGAKIDVLATLDPVGRFQRKPLARPSGALRFINVYINYAKAKTVNIGNVVARIGGLWEDVPCADENHDIIGEIGTSPGGKVFDHADARDMFLLYAAQVVQKLE